MSLLITMLVVGAVIFIILPQLEKLRNTIGESKEISRVERTLLGLKTPVLHTTTMVFTFLAAEGDELTQFNWGQFLPPKYAVVVATIFWALTLWAHFTSLNTAAKITPTDKE